jgi:hypothetical protein
MGFPAWGEWRLAKGNLTPRFMLSFQDQCWVKQSVTQPTFIFGDRYF